jgi:hypothetical protein
LNPDAAIRDRYNRFLENLAEKSKEISLAKIQQYVKEMTSFEPANKTGNVCYRNDNIDDVEATKRENLFDKYPKEAKHALLHEWKNRDFDSFTAWDNRGRTPDQLPEQTYTPRYRGRD